MRLGTAFVLVALAASALSHAEHADGALAEDHSALTARNRALESMERVSKQESQRTGVKCDTPH